MQKLSAADSLFLGLETPECPMNMGLLIMLDGPNSGESIDRLMTELKFGTLKVERHHQSVWSPSFRLGYPYWMNDGKLQVEKHIQHHRLSSPGNKEQLQALVEKLLQRPLDQEQPLWELHLISGLQSTEHALIFKMHHACADGLSALKMFEQTVSSSTGCEVPWPEKDTVSRKQFNLQVLRDLLSSPLNFALSLFTGLALKGYLLLYSTVRLKSKPYPRSRFNAPVGDRRNYATLQFPISAFRQINRHFGSSENEILMTLYSGGLRRYLLEKGELPERSLHAGMPISMMFSNARKKSSNQAGFIRVTLGSRIADPSHRLRVMMKRCARALAKKPSTTWKRLQSIGLNAPPAIMASAASAYIKFLRAGRFRPTYSVITTYMPGPARDITIGDYKIASIYPLSVIYHGCGLSISAMRYAKKIHCGIHADADMLPDPEKLSEYIQLEFEQLYQSASLPDN